MIYSFNFTDDRVIRALEKAGDHGSCRSMVVQTLLKRWETNWDYENFPGSSPVAVATEIAASGEFFQVSEWEDDGDLDNPGWSVADFAVLKDQGLRPRDFGVSDSDFISETVDGEFTDYHKKVAVWIRKGGER